MRGGSSYPERTMGRNDPGAYRDGQEATLQVLRRLEADVERRESRLDARTVRFLGDDADRLYSSRQELASLAEEGGEPLARVKALERHLALLDEVLARLPALNRVLASVRPGFPELDMFLRYKPVDDFSRLPVWVGAAFQRVERFVTHFGLDLRAWTLDETRLRGFKFEFHYRDVPFLLGCEKTLSLNDQLVSRVHTVMATTVPRGLPEVSVVPEKLHHKLLHKPLGLVQDLQVGDERFDQKFLVQATRQEDLEVIDAEVRLGMLRLKETESPQLLVGRGDATVHWFSDPRHAVILEAMELLLALRGQAAGLNSG